MDNMPNTTEEIDLEAAFNSIPEEVQDFIGGDIFLAILSAIQSTFNLKDEQMILVRYVIYAILMNTMDQESGLRFLVDHTINTETGIKIMYVIDTEIITRARNITEFFTDDMAELENLQPDEPVRAPTPNIALASLSDRLKQASIATPLKRDYSLNTEKATTSTPETPPRAIDPYHESIDNE